MASSEGERLYTAEGMAQNLRADGRACTDFRPSSLDAGVIEQASGSARFLLGATDVLVAVKVAPSPPSFFFSTALLLPEARCTSCEGRSSEADSIAVCMKAELGKPRDSAPSMGQLNVQVEFSACASPEFKVCSWLAVAPGLALPPPVASPLLPLFPPRRPSAFLALPLKPCPVSPSPLQSCRFLFRCGSPFPLLFQPCPLSHPDAPPRACARPSPASRCTAVTSRLPSCCSPFTCPLLLQPSPLAFALPYPAPYPLPPPLPLTPGTLSLVLFTPPSHKVEACPPPPPPPAGTHAHTQACRHSMTAERSMSPLLHDSLPRTSVLPAVHSHAITTGSAAPPMSVSAPP